MNIQAPRLLFGRYLEIHLNKDIQLNIQNIKPIKREILAIIDYLSEHLLTYVQKGFFTLNRVYDGFLIKDALNELTTNIDKNLNKSAFVMQTICHACHEILSNFQHREDIRKVLLYVCRLIKGTLIQFKIPTNDRVILNIKDIDLLNLKLIPQNVIAVVLDETVDFTILRYLSNQKVTYVITNQLLQHDAWYHVDPIHRVIVNPRIKSVDNDAF